MVLQARIAGPSRRGGLAALVVAIVAVAFAAAPAAADPIVLRFSHVVAPDTPKGKGAEKFKELAEAATGGRVRIEIHPNSELYKDKEELEALQLGAVEMLAPSLAKFAPLGLPEFEIFDLPFAFPSPKALDRVTEGPIGRTLLARLKDRGIVGLAFWDNGFKLMSADRPLRRPEDFRGLRMRIQASRVLEAQMRALGAVPQAIDFADARRALETGLVDGTENTPSNMATQKMDEVQRYATLSDHGYLGYAVIVNQKVWEALPADLRAALERAMREATVYADGIARAENEAALAAMIAAGHTTFLRLTPEERAAWVAALEPVRAEMASRLGPALIAELRRAAAE
ncbi:DctP family TRAP transporter solute-binding subunit [Siculibacillus lacustris]|uniref:DctP family TRAP transporter solute-binding subunit n=1 Tax=Siculibacillus lacustris TaxID=1549641 RepID=A0A4Q9VHJ8_9HYPH|nr:DctP family TRAP transporter solute-binding subunit [Siculibacillus lacustris]TBW34606.1 DctP family TRAP transporter solute-binding subunit [Siculibacillus lacustris]